jgi:hypothetical protein
MTEGSFSHYFFEASMQGYSVKDSFNIAELRFFDPIGGQTQHPQKITGDAWELSIAKRYISSELPDLTPPEFVELPGTNARKQNDVFNLSVGVTDNTDSGEDITVEAVINSTNAISLTWDSQTNKYCASLGPLSIPGCSIILSATDQSGNMSEPVYLWLPVSPDIEYFDKDNNFVIDSNDLIWLIEEKPYEGWIFDFMQYWETEYEK